MKITFEKIRYFNFLSTGSAGIELDLNANERTLITGKNGSGKSTFLDALCYVLFNKSARDVNLPTLINNLNNKQMLVEIDFSIGTNKYMIRRGAKPSIFEIILNGSPLNEEAANGDFQKYLEKSILGMNFKSFMQLVIVGKASYTPFMRLTKPIRLDKIEDFLDCRIFTSMAELVKNEIAGSKQSIKDIETELSIVKNKITVQESLVKNLHDNHQRKVQENQSAISELLGKIELAQAEVITNQEKCATLTGTIADSSTLTAKVTKLDGLHMKLDYSRKQLSEELKFFNDNCDCPVCKQPIEESFKTEMVDQKTTKFTEIDQACDKIISQTTEINQRLTEIRLVNRQISEVNDHIRDLQGDISSDQRYLAKLQKELDSATDDVSVLNTEKDKLKSYNSDSVNIIERKHKLLDTRLYLDTCALLMKDSGIKSSVVSMYLPILNKMIAKFLDKLEFFVSFELDESFCEVIKSRDRDTFSYNLFSIGEQQRIDLALLFTFITVTQIKNTVSCNLLIFDEILDNGLDSTASSLVIDILKEDFAGKNLMIISHYPTLYEDNVDSHLQFEKIGNYSTLKIS